MRGGYVPSPAFRSAVNAQRSPHVMAGLVPAIHALQRGTKNVNARDKPGHDDLLHE